MLSLHDELIQRRWKVWESKDYSALFLKGKSEAEIFPLEIGFLPTKKLVAVGKAGNNCDICRIPRYVFNFLNTVNSSGGAGFIAVTKADINWHMKIESWKNEFSIHPVRIEKVFSKRLMQIACRSSNCPHKSIKIYLMELWMELLGWVMNHRDYEIWYAYFELKNRNADLHKWYSLFLQFHRSVLEEIIKNKFRNCKK